MKEFIEEARKNKRGLLSIGRAVELLKKADLDRIIHDAEDTKYCPFCGAKAEDSQTPFSKEESKYILKPYIKIVDGERTEKIYYTVPMMRDRAMGPPIFLVGIGAIARGVAKVKMGNEFDPKPSPYAGVGRSAEFETKQAIKALDKDVE